MPQDNEDNQALHHDLPAKKDRVIQPLHDLKTNNTDSDNLAINLIRQKLNQIYEAEPDVQKELEEDRAIAGQRSKHQKFMHELSSSGKSLAEIQTAWHEYYQSLPDHEKHEVWQEFYSNYNKRPAPKSQPRVSHSEHEHAGKVSTEESEEALKRQQAQDKRSVQEVKEQLLTKVKQQSRPKKKPGHWSSIKFGLLTGSVVLVLMLFGFFNERFIAPFITPSRSVSSTPLIIDENGEVGPEPKLIIPKINVDVPVIYDEESIQEEAVQKALEKGVLHYATTPDPGEFGNAVIFGHSSNNIFNSGKYKYVFVQLNKLVEGDTFFIHKNGVRYAYRVYEKKIVTPDQVSVLGNTEKEATMTLITCDPPGTAINRLVVIGEQISPEPSTNVASSVPQNVSANIETIPSNAPSLWQRFTNWLSG